MKRMLMSLAFGCVLLTGAIGVDRLLYGESTDWPLGLKWLIYLGIFLFGVLAFHKLTGLSKHN